MTFSPILADLRFGCGLAQGLAPPEGVEPMLAAVRGPDRAGAAYPIPTFDTAEPGISEYRALGRIKNDSAAAMAEYGAAQDRMRLTVSESLAATFARAATTHDGLRERLTAFWANHFAIRSRVGFTPHLVTPYVEGAIRPHVAGSFADMLFAVSTHPMMLSFLDQTNSIGPDSPANRNGRGGLNENLAREILELHTLGVDGPYSQADVRELAELLTGVTWTFEDGAAYRPRRAEPGAETVLGITYSADASLDTVRAALDDLARHPATARHIATKLARHFIAEAPDPTLIATMTDTFFTTGGDLGAVTEAMLRHPAAWAPGPGKVKTPTGFLMSALRALGADATRLDVAGRNALIRHPLLLMGQEWERPPGPDGWPDTDQAWVTPQGMAARITWAMGAPSRLLAELPDPRVFVRSALDDAAPAEVVFAAGASEDVAEGIGVILSAPAFQRWG